MWWASGEALAQGAALDYTVTGGELVPHVDVGGVLVPDPAGRWQVTGGSMSLELYDILDGFQRAVYAVREFAIEVVEPSGTVHTLTVVPDGSPSPSFTFGGIPDSVQDSGLVNVFSGGFLDLTVYDLSIDGLAVDQTDTMGGPAFVGSSWTGTFPKPSSFSVSSQADLPSLGFSGDFSLDAARPSTLVHSPISSLSHLGVLSMMGLVAGVFAWRLRARTSVT